MIDGMVRNEGFIFEKTHLGERGLELAKSFHYNVILLDLMLPDIEGYEVLRCLRTARVNTPILILSGLIDTNVKVRCFGLGADDYLTKPFHRRELAARIRALMRRTRGNSESVIRTGRLTVMIGRNSAEIDGQPVRLTAKEYAILELLSLRKGAPLAKESFPRHLYGGTDEPDERIVDVFVSKLRKKLFAASGGDDYIGTVWGRGYVLRDPRDTNVIHAVPARTAPKDGKKRARRRE